MQLQFLGHACFLATGPAGSVIFDPYITGNPTCPVKAEDLQVDAILLSHGHADHLGDTLAIAARNKALVVAPYELACYCQARGAQVHAMHIGGSYNFDFGWVKLTPAWHGAGIIDPDGEIYQGGMPCGFLLRQEDQIIYHAGDTGLFGDMRLIGLPTLGRPVDVALLPIGDNFVMGVEDAALATEFISPSMVVPMHYNTFPVIRQDPHRFKALVESRCPTRCKIMNPGDTIEV